MPNDPYENITHYHHDLATSQQQAVLAHIALVLQSTESLWQRTNEDYTRCTSLSLLKKLPDFGFRFPCTIPAACQQTLWQTDYSSSKQYIYRCTDVMRNPVPVFDNMIFNRR